MYTRYFGFKDKPFSLVPNPAYLFLSSRHRLALTYLEYAIKENIGFVLLTGEIGTGKTTLIRYLLTTIPTSMDVAVITNTNVDSHDLVKMILQELSIDQISEHKSENLKRLKTYLTEQYAKGRRVALFVDEAQNLNQEAIEEVRMLSNMSTDSEVLLQIILVGQPEIRRAIQHNELRQLAQRIPITFHLQALEREEVDAYITYRIEQAEGEAADLFDPQAIDLISEQSGGIPRMINVLCDISLVYAYADDQKRITADIVERVIQDRGDEWRDFPEIKDALEEGQPEYGHKDAGHPAAQALEVWRQDLDDLQNKVETLEKDLSEVKKIQELFARKEKEIQQIKAKAQQIIKSRLSQADEEVKRLHEITVQQQEEIERLRGNNPAGDGG